MTQSLRISGLQGLDGQRYSEEAQTLPQMKGGYNVELIDGEWWTRSGLRPFDNPVDPLVEGCADIPFWWALSKATGNEIVLANPWWAVLYHTATGKYAPAYDAKEAAAAVTSTLGSTTVTYGGAERPMEGDLLFFDPGVENEGHEVRVVLADATGSSPNFVCTVNKAVLEHAPGTALLVESIAPYSTVNALGGFLGEQAVGVSVREDGPITIDTGGLTIFEQLVSYDTDTADDNETGGGTAPFVNPEIFAGRAYAIITSNFEHPVAFALNHSGDPTKPIGPLIRGFFRNTAENPSVPIETDIAVTTNLGQSAGRGEYCGVVGNRLFIGRAPDDHGRWPDTTFWISRYGDFTRWHIGRQGGNGKGSFFTLDDFSNPLMGMAPMSNAMILHRNYSQDTATLTGGAATPVNVVKGLKGFGLVSTRSLVPTNRGHYLWTQSGPAVFDGTQLQHIGQSQKRLFESMGLYGNLPRYLSNTDAESIFDIEGKGVLFGFEDLARQRIVWVSKNGIRHQRVSTPPTDPHEYNVLGRLYNFARTAVAFDYATGSWFNYDIPTITGAGQQYNVASAFETVVLTCDGYVYQWSPNDRATDEPLSGHTLLTREREAVDAYVETGWMNFGTETRKMLNKLLIEFRSFQHNDTSSERKSGVLYEINEDWKSTPTAMLHMCTVEIYADTNDEDEAFQEIECIMEVQKMWAYSTEENRQSARLIFELTPRATANQFKFGFRNAYQADVPIVGVERAPFRIAAFEPGWDETGSDRMRYPANRR